MQKLAIIDYGMGNLHSVSKAVQTVAPEQEVIVTSCPDTIYQADRVIFPGVGAIRDCMSEIHRLNIGEIVANFVKEKPVLGICVGMQALMNFSEENGGVDCLGLVDGRVKYFGDQHVDQDGTRLKVPHMGWNIVHQQVPHPLWKDVPQDTRFYFVHSYHIHCDNANKVAATANYGITFDAALFDNNLFAVQFHPEKSQHAGLQLLKNFTQWNGKF
ncbi:MAG: imidazole glycerol phosphate synthase subunit HisH [Kangiellaceae bacterium]|nr:imidazole glycerol phosphate synthase subunit HisH [Kangiellaceae bacterium]|tara:strand:+ start:3101 stop:3745 length:645 start_codon:yes stop_codon:yes gene_type:complete